MSSELRLRRGTDTQHDSFTGAEAEVTVNTTNKSVHVHDGTTTGGFELARSDLNNVDDAVFAAKAASAGISGGGDFISTITGITKANPAVVTVSTSHGYVDGQQVTITGVGGMTQVNGITFYVNVLTATTFSLYSDIALTTTVNSTSYTTYTSGGEAAGSVSAGAPISASYVTINAESGMPNERRLQAGTGLTLTDGGAGGAVSLAANLAATAPSNLGSANAGVSNVIARADHVHAMPIASDVGAVPTARTVSAGTGLSGGGALSSNITLSLNANLHMLTDVTIGTLANGDVIMYNEATGVFENSNTFAKSSILLNNTNVAVNSITKFNFIGTGLSATVNGTDATRIDLNFTGLLDAEGVQDIVGAMVESNTENGIAVTYDDANAKINFDVNDPVITLSGDVTGTATMTNLGNVTISTTIAANSVALGSDTTGNYVATITGANGISVTGSGVESAAITLEINPTEGNFVEAMQDLVGTMVSGNSESGIAVTYNDTLGKLDFAVGNPTVTLSGAVTGAATITNLANATITTSIAENAVALGTNTTGNYVATVAANATSGYGGIVVSGSGSETAAVTIGINPANSDFIEGVQDIVGGMVESNTENGIAVTYDDNTGKLNFDVADPVITVSGAVSGSATMTNLGNVTITVTQANDSVALGTNTTGNYVATVAANATTGFGGITVSGSGSETAAVVIGINPANTDFIEGIQDIVGGMVETNTESGISVTYDDLNGKLNFDVADPVITLSGDVTGSATMTNLGNVTIAATIAANSVALGTDTTGNYIATVAANATAGYGGIVVSGSGSETAAVTIGIDPANADFIEGVQDAVGGMVTGNTENGIAVTYDDATGKLNFDVADPVITLSGDVTGSATMTNLGNVTITTTIAANSIELGTDTTGNYVATITAGSGITIANAGVENANVTISVNPSEAGLLEALQDVVGGMVETNTESGISVTYNDATGKLDFDVADPVITLSGDVTGSGTLTNLSNLTITTTIAANSVALGTDTTGNYVATVAANATTGYGGITISGSGSETAAVTIGIDPANADFIENIQDIVGGMVATNTENGIAVTYNDTTGKLDFDVADPVITLSGDVTGSATMTNLGNVTITATIAANSVALGTDTTGNYVATIAANATTGYGGITISGSGSENAAVTIGIDPSNADFIENMQDLIGGMVSTNTENGIAVTYNDSTNKLDFDVGDFTITLTGDVTGVGTVTNLANVSFATTIQPNSVELGTDTTGNYIATIAANATTGYGGIVVSGSGSETAAVTIGINPANADFIEGIQDIVGGMVETNTESGISVTYNDTTNKLNFDVADPVITLSGDVTGSATMTNLGDVTITATIAANSVALGTDTTGNYIATIAANATTGYGGIIVSGSGSETAAAIIGIDPTNADFIEGIQDIVSGMITGNTESGIAVTYNDTTGKLDFDVADPVITLSGDVTGSATMTNLGNVTITTTIAANSIELGTDTTGNYVATIAPNNTIGFGGIVVAGSGSENAAVTIGIDKANTDFRNTVQDVAALMFSTGSGLNVTYNDTTNAITIDPNDPTITLSGDVTGSGTITNLGNVTITATIAANSVELGTDTTGNYVATITANSSIGSSGILVTNSGTENAGVVIGLDSTNTDFRNTIRDLARAILPTGLSNGITYTYNDSTNALDIDPNDPVITLAGDITGSATMTNLGNVTITATIAENSVALGTDTTGNYVATITANTNIGFGGIVVSGSGTENAGVVIGIDKSNTDFRNTVQDVAALMFATGSGLNVTYNDTTNAITIDPNDPTITITGSVIGSATMTDLGNVSISVAQANDSVTLGTHTTGNYVANVTAGTGIAVVGANVETADITISVDTGEAQFVNEIQDIFGLMLSGNTENGVTVTYDPDLAKVNFDVNDPTITLTGDVSGSIQMVDLQSVTITCTVADNSHEHTIANVVGLQDALDAKLGGTGGGVTGTLTTQDIVPTTNGAYSIGNTSVRYSAVWATTLNGTAVQAQYADLAERYQADAKYPIGTVVKLGGSKEITATTTENDTQVIGVVSENPAYLMNDGAGDPDEWLPIAMTGRVRVKIVGPVTKGQRIVSSDEPGVAMAVNDNELTSLMTVVGRALRSNTDPNIKLVECIIGKF
jgi:fibronectin-binding autotransporter adhesin